MASTSKSGFSFKLEVVFIVSPLHHPLCVPLVNSSVVSYWKVM